MRFLAPRAGDGTGSSTLEENHLAPAERVRVIAADADDTQLRDTVFARVVKASDEDRPGCTPTDSGRTIEIAGALAELSSNGQSFWACTIVDGFNVQLNATEGLEGPMRVAAKRMILPENGRLDAIDFGEPPKGYSVTSDALQPDSRGSFAIASLTPEVAEGSAPDPSTYRSIQVNITFREEATDWDPESFSRGTIGTSPAYERVDVRGTRGVVVRTKFQPNESELYLDLVGVSWMEYDNLAVSVSLMGGDVSSGEAVRTAESLTEISRDEWLQRFPPHGSAPS